MNQITINQLMSWNIIRYDHQAKTWVFDMSHVGARFTPDDLIAIAAWMRDNPAPK